MGSTGIRFFTDEDRRESFRHGWSIFCTGKGGPEEYELQGLDDPHNVYGHQSKIERRFRGYR